MAPVRVVHARKTIPLAPIHSFTRQIVLSLYQELSNPTKIKSDASYNVSSIVMCDI